MFEKILCRRRTRISTLGAALGRTQKSIGQKTPHGVWYRALRATWMPPTRPLYDAPPVHFDRIEQRRKHKMARRVLRDVRGSHRKALREIHPRRRRQAVSP